MKYHLKNKATHWDGDTLVRAWCVMDEDGNRMSDWMTHRRAVVFKQQLLARQSGGD